jgi:murein DD-endopeptidase MepM/ murein hydrolase activator NlpD
MLRSGIVFALIACGVRAAAAVQGDPAPEVHWTPANPVQGSVIQIVVAPRGDLPLDTLRGHLAGQPLHFERGARGEFRALGGVPVGAASSLPVQIIAYAGNDSTFYFIRIPVTGASFAVERLRVAPRFVAQPDSTLAARIAAERTAAIRVARRSHGTPRIWSGVFAPPSAGRITSPFGKGREYNGSVQSRHLGTDFSGVVGAPVRAPNRGVVSLTGRFYYGGNVVYLDHGAGLTTAYLHLSRVLVEPGDTVAPGQTIGLVGATGRVTGPHLHWIARYGEITVDPMSLAGADLPAFGAATARDTTVLAHPRR